MSESMLEHVARNIKAKVPRGYGMTDDEAREYALATLQIARNPSLRMIEAGLAQLSDITVRDAKAAAWDALRCYRAMIDAALSETRKP